MTDHVQMRHMPDLRDSDGAITLEHCSVMLEKISAALHDFDGQEQFDASIIDPTILLDYFNELFEPPQFQRLFSTEMGKGVLAGIYIHWIMERVREEEDDA